MFVDKRTYKERFNTCKACEYFENGTCGPPVIGKKIQKGTSSVQLCGCIMKIKCNLKIAKCPLNKWGRELSRSEIKEIEELIKDVRKDPRNKNEVRFFTQDQNTRLSKITGKNICLKCQKKQVRSLFLEMEKQYNERNL